LLTPKHALSARFGAALWALRFGKLALFVDTHDRALPQERASTGRLSIAAALKVQIGAMRLTIYDYFAVRVLIVLALWCVRNRANPLPQR